MAKAKAKPKVGAKSTARQKWTAARVLGVARGFQPACVLAAGAELDVFGVLAGGPKTAAEGCQTAAAGGMTAAGLAEAIGGDPRATAILADALTAMGLLEKSAAGQYSLAEGVAEVLTTRGASSTVAMVRHNANCMRNWAQLAQVVRTGRRAERQPSVRGAAADLESFIEAMQVVSRQAAGPLVARIGPPPFKHLLDVGGGPATWTIAFLRAAPRASRATLYDLPDVLPIAEKHLREAHLLDRVTLVGGDFQRDPALPAGADLAWVSAIVHQNSRAENRDLFRKVHAALAPGGTVLIRDVVMDESRTVPADGAMFAVNMLVNTPGGGTFTFRELSEDLAAAGFAEAVLLVGDEGMSSVVGARKL
jgi:precorrin-6B methylase 2